MWMVHLVELSNSYPARSLTFMLSYEHSCGSVAFWYRSGSADRTTDTSVAFKMPTKSKFFSMFFCLLLFEGTFTSVFKDKKSQRSYKTVEGSGFRIRTNSDISGSRRPKNLRIHNTGLWTSLYSSDFTQKTSCVFVTQSLDDILEPVLSLSTSAAQPLLFTPQRRQRNSGRTSRNSTPTREAYNLR
jgi:hypothetical protein